MPGRRRHRGTGRRDWRAFRICTASEAMARLLRADAYHARRGDIFPRRIGRFRGGSCAEAEPISRISPRKAIRRPLAAEEVARRFDGGFHRGGVGVVGVVEDSHAAGFHPLQAHFGARRRRRGCVTIWASVRPITRPTATAARALAAVCNPRSGNERFDAGGLDREMDAVPVAVWAFETPQISLVLRKAEGEQSPRNWPMDLHEAGSSPLTISVPLGFEPFDDAGVFAANTGEIAEAFEVLGRAIGDDGDVRQGDVGERCGFRRDDWCPVRGRDNRALGSAGKIARGTPMSLLKLLGEIEPRRPWRRTESTRCLVPVLPLLPAMAMTFPANERRT